MLCFLPLYHIYGLNVALNPMLTLGATLVLMPRFNVPQLLGLLVSEGVTMMPIVPPALNALNQAAEAGQFPNDHKVGWVKSGAAPLAPELARRFTELTGIPINQGYGMTEASPVTHVGYLDPPDCTDPNRSASRWRKPIAACSTRTTAKSPAGEPGELVMRGPQFMLGYWKEPQATAAVLRDGWYWSGDIVRRDAQRLLLRPRPPQRDDQVQRLPGRARRSRSRAAWSIPPCATAESSRAPIPTPEKSPAPSSFSAKATICDDAMKKSLCGFVADRLTHYKQPREIRFVDSRPPYALRKNPPPRTKKNPRLIVFPHP